MERSFNIAVVGVSSTVGAEILTQLARRRFPAARVHAVDSDPEAGTGVDWGDDELPVQDLDVFAFDEVQIAFFATAPSVAVQHAPRAVAAGAIVIDASGAFRDDADVPLVVPEINAGALAGVRRRQIVANPGAAAIHLLMALKPLHDAAVLERICVATYQPVAEDGAAAIAELARQSALALNGMPLETHVYPRQIAFNLLPHIGDFAADGYTQEEVRLGAEVGRVLEDDTLRLSATCVRVPVFYGQAQAVNIETRRKLTAAEARRLLRAAPGMVVLDERRDGGYPTPVSDAVEEAAVQVGRIREDRTHARGLSLWIVADSVRKGAAVNSLQIAEELVRAHL